MHHFITGVAGFIGSQLADALLATGDSVSGVDDLSLGRREFLNDAQTHSTFNFFCADISQRSNAEKAMVASKETFGQINVIWHLAANSDISAGNDDASIDFSKTFLTTYAMMEAAKSQGVRAVAFASTSAVYGENDAVLDEQTGPLLPISNYGATKLASEAILSAAAETHFDHLWIFRFPNVVGPRLTHGAIFDFVARLAAGEPQLKVLGDGMQEKPYLHVSELIDAMRHIVENARGRRNLFNIGPSGANTSVRFIAEKTIDAYGVDIPIAYTGGDRGWVGDVPRFKYDASRLARLGWRPTMTSDDAVIRAIREAMAGRRAVCDEPYRTLKPPEAPDARD